MVSTTRLTVLSLFAVLASSPARTRAEDWPLWGRTPSRNMAAPAADLPHTFKPGRYVPGTKKIDMSTTENVRWAVQLGSQTFGNPTVAGGRVYLGTNNDMPHGESKYPGDRALVVCLDEKTGDLIWQLNVPKLGAGKVSDWEYLGICSSPAVDLDAGRVYVVTNLCEVLCLDIDGMANGNDGPYQDEAAYLGGAGKPPIPTGPRDGDIIWRFDMREELQVFPHNITSSSPLFVGTTVYVATSNGVDWSHLNIPNPRAPALIALDKKTGALLGEEASGISTRLMHCNWSSPAFGRVGEQDQLIFGAGDGFCYGFDPVPVKDEDGFGVFKVRWRYDCNPPHYRFSNGKPIKYATRRGPSEIIGTPVLYEGRVYVTIGQDPEHGEGIGILNCIDASGTGNVTTSGRVWAFDKIGRSISTPSIVDGLVYIAEYAGIVHCLDARTGTPYWEHDTKSHLWGSTLVADGKVYIGNEDGYLTVLAAGKTRKVVSEIDLKKPIYSTAVVANGVLFIASQSHLFAVAATK